MGRYLGSSCRHCRREGMKLMLKGIRCEMAKCPIEKKQRNVARACTGGEEEGIANTLFGCEKSKKSKGITASSSDSS